MQTPLGLIDRSKDNYGRQTPPELAPVPQTQVSTPPDISSSRKVCRYLTTVLRQTFPVHLIGLNNFSVMLHSRYMQTMPT